MNLQHLYILLSVLALVITTLACGSPITPTPTPAADNTATPPPPALATLFPRTLTPSVTATPTPQIQGAGKWIAGTEVGP